MWAFPRLISYPRSPQAFAAPLQARRQGPALPARTPHFAVKLYLSILNLLFGLFKSRRSLIDLFLRVLKCRSAVIYGGLSGSYLLLGIIYCVSRIGKLSFVELKRRLCGYDIIALLEILIRGHGALAVIKFLLHSLNLRRGIRDLRFKLLILFSASTSEAFALSIWL